MLLRIVSIFFLLAAGMQCAQQPAPLAEETQKPSRGKVATSQGAPGAEGDHIIVASYNVQNYLPMDRATRNGARVRNAPKPEQSISALIQVISDIQPDVLAVMEMGSPQQFQDFRRRLEAAGMDHPHAEYLDAADDRRRLALVSRFPIVSRDSEADLRFELRGVMEPVRRGFLDVTLQVRPDYRMRVIAVHLKSKRPVPQGEALIRRHEAQLLRDRIDRILTEEPEVNLVVLGDLNGTKNEPAVQEVIGVRGTPTYMADLWLEDKFGDRWTHFWTAADVYSRFDYILVSPGLFREVIKEESGVYRSPYWRTASDHRPVVAAIQPVDR